MTGWWGGYEAEPVVRQALAYGASQDGWELHEAMKLVESVDPEVVLEIGCDRGGTLYAWGMAAPAARIWGISLMDNSYETGGSGGELEAHRAVVLRGDSHNPLIRGWFAEEVGSVDVLVIDGDHSAEGVRQDLADYGPLVRPGGLVLLHDICSPPEENRPVEVMQVWREVVTAGGFLTEEIVNPEGGPGWGVIRVQPGDAAWPAPAVRGVASP